MPVKRVYTSVPIRMADGSRLLPDLPVSAVGAANFDEKVNFVNDIGEVSKRAGWDFPAPLPDWLGDGLADFNDGQPAEALAGVRRPNGTYAIVGCGAGFIKYFDYDSNAWVTIGSGYATEFDAGFRWWQIVPCAGYAVFNNGLDLLCTWQVGDAAVIPDYEFREAGYASCGHICEYTDGVLMCADILEINDDAMAEVMDDTLPYRRLTDNDHLLGDGVWTSRTAAAAQLWNGVAWSPTLGLFAAVSSDGASRAMTSPNGVNWTLRALGASDYYAIAWSPSLQLFAAVGDNIISTSPDGVNWTDIAPPQANIYRGIAWSPELGRFAAVSTNGTNHVMTSDDGVTWTNRVNANVRTAIAWSPELGLFCAVGTGLTVSTSPTGITWTSHVVTSNTWSGIAWSPTLGLFCAVAANSGTNKIMTSPDGTNWTLRTHPSATLAAIAWSEELGVFVATASAGANRFLVSQDGINWTAQANPSGTFLSIAWSPTLGIFASPSSSTAIVATSDAGVIAVTRRITFRRVWSNVGDPRDFAATVPGTADAYVSPTDLTLAWPMASLEAGDEIIIEGAGTSGGNLTTTIVSISGVDVVLTDPVLTTVTDADVFKSTALDSIVGYDDIEDDGSAILMQIPLKTQLISFKASGHIWQTYYTGDLDTPFAKNRVTKKNGVAPRFPRAVVNIVNDNNEEYLLFIGARHFYRFDLGSQAPQQAAQFMGAEKSLFFDRIAGIGPYDVWAADNGCTDEVFFAYLWDDYEIGYYGANRAIALKYAKGCESIAEVDAFNFTCAATVQKPLGSNTCDELESWFLMGDGDGKITLYGQSNLEVLTRRRYGELFDAVLGGGLTPFGTDDTGKYLRRFSITSSNPDASQGMEVSIYGTRSANVEPTLLETRTLTDPRFPGAMGLYYRKPYFKYRIVADTDEDLRIAGFVWRVAGADTQDIDQLE